MDSLRRATELQQLQLCFILITIPRSYAAVGCAVATFDNLKEAKFD